MQIVELIDLIKNVTLNAAEASRILHSSIVKGTIENRGFRILYLPPYSPVLNPIEEFWSKLKAGVKREILTTSNHLTPRIIQPAYLVTLLETVKDGYDMQSLIFHVVFLKNQCYSFYCCLFNAFTVIFLKPLLVPYY